MDLSSIPPNIIKMISNLDNYGNLIIENKKHSDKLYQEYKLIHKDLSKYFNKEINKLFKKNKKPKGFAIPKLVSDTLCIFMEQPVNTKISKTMATKYLNEYIKNNNLIDPNNKKIILPDDKLWKLIGDEAKYEESLNYFNIQKYLNKHFNLL